MSAVTDERVEEIVQVILAAAAAMPGRVLPTQGPNMDLMPGGYGQGWGSADGPCCAVGAGVLYAGLAPNNHPISDGLALNSNYLVGADRAFADHYGVSLDFAWGLSNGFEGQSGDSIDEDYLRGRAAGQRIFQALYQAREVRS